eukprot:symbB.v1.2.033852.t1/scaffold4263.1/size42195/3
MIDLWRCLIEETSGKQAACATHKREALGQTWGGHHSQAKKGFGQGATENAVKMGVQLCKLPDIFIDSIGYAFTLPLFRLLGGCQIECYVPDPAISMVLLEQVALVEIPLQRDHYCRAKWSNI